MEIFKKNLHVWRVDSYLYNDEPFECTISSAGYELEGGINSGCQSILVKNEDILKVYVEGEIEALSDPCAFMKLFTWFRGPDQDYTACQHLRDEEKKIRLILAYDSAIKYLNG